MLNSHLMFAHHSRGRQLEPEETASPASSNKRPRDNQEPSAKTGGDKKRRSRTSDTALRTISGLSFACPFYKYSHDLYGGKHGCASWCNERIETVVRHHVLGKHRAMNESRLEEQEGHCIDDARFEEVAKFKRVRALGESKEKHAEEIWKAVYSLLFQSSQETRLEIPDPYYVSRAQPNTLGYSMDDLASMVRHQLSERPSFALESEDFFQYNERLERERSREKKKVRLEADLQEGQLQAQIRDVREKQALREQEIDADFDERIRSARSRFVAVLTGGSEAQTQSYGNHSSASIFDVEASIGSDPQFATQASLSQIPESVQGHAETPYGLVEQSTADMLQQLDSTASTTATSLQLWSSNPALSTNQCALCPTILSEESLLCEECHLAELIDIQ